MRPDAVDILNAQRTRIAEANRDRAAEARAGGALFLRAWYRRCGPEAQKAAALIVSGEGRDPHLMPAGPLMLPESAFDWPIYRAAQCVPIGNGRLGPSEDVSRMVKDHLSELRDGYPIEFDEWHAERFPQGWGDQ